MVQDKIIARLKTLGINQLESVETLSFLDGDYLNNETLLPNGTLAKILDDGKKYWACEVCAGDDRCFGVAADDTQIAVFSYLEGGKDCTLVAWIKL